VLTPIQPTIQTTLLPTDTFQGQKTERSQDTPLKVVDKKSDVPSAREEIPREQVEKATEKLNRLMGIIDKRLKFSVHSNPDCVVVKVVDQETGDVLNEIPSKQALDLLSSFSDTVGLVVNKKV